jgi:hypothetical protein
MAKGTCRGKLADGSACEQVFSGYSSFDLHQTVLKNKRGTVICHPPKSVGLVNKEGIWFGQADPRFSDVVVDKPAPKVYTCKCGAQYRGTGKRGRPPAACTDCGGKGILL